jgi:hypothetical protein
MVDSHKLTYAYVSAGPSLLLQDCSNIFGEDAHKIELIGSGKVGGVLVTFSLWNSYVINPNGGEPRLPMNQ